MNRWMWIWVVVAGFSLNTYASSEFVPIQEKAQGQSLGGSSLNNDSLYSNPAASVFSQIYSLEGTYELPKTFAISVVDTKTSEVGGGLGYFRMKADDSDLVLQGARLGLAGRVSSQVGLGLTGKMLWGQDIVTRESAKMTDVDLGVLTQFDILQLGLTLRNAFGGNQNMGYSREWVAGARVNYQQTMFFSVTTVALASNVKPYQYGFGVEYVSPYFFSLKGGFRALTETGENFWSGGVSLLAPKIAVHYAVEFAAGSKPMNHTVAVAFLM